MERWVGRRDGRRVRIYASRPAADAALRRREVEAVSPIDHLQNTDLLNVDQITEKEDA